MLDLNLLPTQYHSVNTVDSISDLLSQYTYTV